MIAYFNSAVVGTGTDEDPVRPEINDYAPKCENAYDVPGQDAAIVRVYADPPTVDALAEDFERLYEGWEL